ncbi:unnamed protein product [Arctogadus glacialis]
MLEEAIDQLEKQQYKKKNSGDEEEMEKYSEDEDAQLETRVFNQPHLHVGGASHSWQRPPPWARRHMHQNESIQQAPLAAVTIMAVALRG